MFSDSDLRRQISAVVRKVFLPVVREAVKSERGGLFFRWLTDSEKAAVLEDIQEQEFRIIESEIYWYYRLRFYGVDAGLPNVHKDKYRMAIAAINLWLQNRKERANHDKHLAR